MSDDSSKDTDTEKAYVAAPAPNEQVLAEAPAKPPRASVQDADPDAPAADTEGAGAKLERKRDYLEGFLKKSPQTDNANGPGGKLQQDVIAALKEIYDPEIPVNIYDLGLIYGVEVDDESDVTVIMTLTTPHCPVAESMPGEVELRAASVPGVRDAEVNLVWDPPWGPEKMTDEARLELGML